MCHYKLFAEYRGVLARMVTQNQLEYSQKQVDRMLGAMLTVFEEVGVRYLWRPNLPDEGDNFVYETAFAASPATIVTHHLRDFRAPELHWPGVGVKTPQQILTERTRYA